MAAGKTNVRWQMQESSQRALCRTAFLLLGVLPLFLAIAFCAVQFLPAYQLYRANVWSSWLSGRLGVDVQVAAVESLAPERFVLHGVRLSHPESKASLGRIRSVAVSRKSAVWTVQLDQPELETRQLSATWRMVHDWFVCRPQAIQPALRIQCDDLRFRDVDQEQVLEQIAIEIYSQAERTVVGAKFRLPSAEPNAQASVLRIVRQHSDVHQSTVMELDSGMAGLPCKLIWPALPCLEKLGDNAVFQGKLTVNQRNQVWEANVSQSWIAGIDFGKLTSGTDYRVTGHGFVWCENLRVNHRGLQHAYGKVTVEHGRIDSKLLGASHRSLEVELPRPVHVANVDLHSFEQLQAIIEIAPGTFKLAGGIEKTLSDSLGRSRPLVPGTLVADAAGELAIRANFEAMPLHKLVEALSYDQGVTTASGGSAENAVGTGSWIAQRAALWLPLEYHPSLTRADTDLPLR